MFKFALNAVVCLVLGATLVACQKQQETTGPKPALSVTITQVTTQPIERTIVASGSVAAWQEIPVGSEVSGLAIKQVLVEEGDSVKKGQLLAKLNDTVLRAQLAQQQANVDSARASFVQAQADLKRNQNLRKQGVISVQAEDSALAAARTAAATLVSRQGALAETEARLAQTSITAPADGFISSRSAVIGQIVSAGTELFRIVRDGRLELRADVPETLLSALRPGLMVDVTAGGVKPVEGTIRLVSPSVDTRTRLGTVYITLPMDSGYRTGMFARASMKTPPSPAFVVPQKAIAYRDGKAGVFSVSADNVVSFHPVDTGTRMNQEVEIVSGVKEGEQIVVTGAGLLEDGDRVDVVSQQAQNTHVRLSE